MTNYKQQAEEFLQKTNTTFAAKFLKNGKYFDDDKEERDIYEISLVRGERVVKFTLGQSINNSSKFLPSQSFALRLNEAQIDALREKLCNGDLTKKTLKNFQLAHVVQFPKKPTAYDVLAGLQKHDVGSFEDFCGEFGYDTDSRKAEKIYQAVLEEWTNVQILWNDSEIDLLREIQ